MEIAIQAADLDYNRIDGTRVYILNMLRHFGKLSPNDRFLIYHRNDFNPELAPPDFPNYEIKKIKAPFLWTQTKFAFELLKDKPDILWMPMHNMPAIRRGDLKTIVTVHDLAYKYFPKYFPKKDLFELNFLGDMAIQNSNKLIAVSNSTKNDILKFYPRIKEDNIRVIHHGFDPDIFSKDRNLEIERKVKASLKISGKYILYSGAIQPRKNIKTLVEAFEIYKGKSNSDIKLVLAGGNAWLWKEIIKRAERSSCSRDIIATGKIKFDDLGHLMRGAMVYVYPSLYEGFGITILEAFAAKVPVITSSNSSLLEVGGDAAEYFDANDPDELAEKINKVLADEDLRKRMVIKGGEHIKKFSWEKCARETLEWIKS